MLTPQLIAFELTERCNNNCLHCYIRRNDGIRQARNAELSTREIKRILVEAAALGCLNIRLSGGEPLMRRDFEEIYVFARKQGFRVTLLTNATLLTPRLARLFCYIRPLEKIEVTLYGMNKDSYERISRSPGSFAAAQAGIRLLRRYKIPFRVKGIVLPFTTKAVARFETWVHRITGSNASVPYVEFINLHGRRDEAKNICLRKLRLTPEEYVAFLMRDRKAYLHKMREFCAKFSYPRGERIFNCSAGLTEASVDAYGYLQPCALMRHPNAVYDLKKGTLREAFGHFFPFVRTTMAKNQRYIQRCARCFLKGLCRQCPARSWMEYGTMDTPGEYCCSIAHLQARTLGLLEEGERAWQIRNWRTRLSAFTGTEITL